MDIPPRVFIFGAKAAPGYHLAKVIIHAINLVGARINDDERIKGKLKVAYWPNYGVSSAERSFRRVICRSRFQLLVRRHSGTGNMKFALNGALYYWYIGWSEC